MSGAPAGPSVWVCIPTYNERENVAGITRSITEVFDTRRINGHILIIDDNSPDGTGVLADELGLHDSRIRVIHRPEKEGIGPAYRDGFRLALAEGADLILEMDCDFSHDPVAIPDLVRATRTADVVLGSRYTRGGRIEDWGPLRRVISRAGSLYAQLLLGLPIKDLTGGFKCFRREVLANIQLDDMASAGYVFQIEMTYRAIQQGYRVVEVPITFTERQRGSSKMSAGIVKEAATKVPLLRWGRH